MQHRVLAQRYRLIEQLGRGGMGSVWLAEHMELGVRVAVKLMDPELAATKEGLSRFKREAQAAASIDSPNIVRVSDFGVEGDTPYLVMELLKGESLGQRLRRTGTLELPALSNIYSQLGKAITKAHELGIVHRDLKPDNIFLVSDDDNDIAKIIDFGIAKRTSLAPGQLSGVETRTGAMLGSPFYMSPEQASGSRDVDFRTDIWSLGVIAFECITGKRPYASDSLGRLVLEICTGTPRVPSTFGLVPNGFDEWYARCTAKEPSARFSSAREAAAALSQLGRSQLGKSSIELLPIERTERERVRAASAKSASLDVASAEQAQTAVVTPHERSASDHAGNVALTLGDAKQQPKKARLAVQGLVSLLVLGGAATAIVAAQRAFTTPSPDLAPSAASPQPDVQVSRAQDSVTRPPAVVTGPAVAPVTAESPASTVSDARQPIVDSVSTSQSGATQSGATQSGATQSGTSQSGATQSGTSPSNAQATVTLPPPGSRRTAISTSKADPAQTRKTEVTARTQADSTRKADVTSRAQADSTTKGEVTPRAQANSTARGDAARSPAATVEKPPARAITAPSKPTKSTNPFGTRE